ncbi:MAG TPA: DUF6036 family nucleotidyltransferase [Thermoleophilaceae bacterium]|jgi:hypothetical protein
MNIISDKATADRVLAALAEQLTARGERYELVVIGGSALQALGLIDRPTADVDVLALAGASGLTGADPLPPGLAAARELVGRDFSMPTDWLNPGPTSLLDLGLPDGFMRRVVSRPYGSSLTVHFASRFDQIHFKLYATVDQGPGRHEADLRALDPTPVELQEAARWARSHDPSPGFDRVLRQVLRALGVEDANHRA